MKLAKAIQRESPTMKLNSRSTSFFQNQDIFVQLDELDELDKITHAWIGFNYSLTQAQKTL